MGYLWNILDESLEFEFEVEVELIEDLREKVMKVLILFDENCKKCFVYM